jgi:hypothetical protein
MPIKGEHLACQRAPVVDGHFQSPVDQTEHFSAFGFWRRLQSSTSAVPRDAIIGNGAYHGFCWTMRRAAAGQFLKQICTNKAVAIFILSYRNPLAISQKKKKTESEQCIGFHKTYSLHIPQDILPRS